MSLFKSAAVQRNISPLIYTAVILFGSSSWINVCSVWMELPMMVFELPEKWNLPSYLSVIVQVAIVGPLLFGLYKRFGERKIDEAPLIVILIGFEAVCMALLAFFWNYTGSIGGAEHSIAMFVIFFLLSAVDCSSNVIFLPYMASFKPAYTTAYFIGMGLSALVPTIVGLVQGAGQVVCISSGNSTNASKYPQSIPPSFGVDVYNLIICGWMCLTLAAFCVLHWSKFGRFERAIDLPSHCSEVPLVETTKDDVKNTLEHSMEMTETYSEFPAFQYLLLLFLTAWTCALMNGILPSIQTYASMPYGQEAFHLSIALPRIANTIGCFIPFFLSVKSTWLVTVLTALSTGICGYIMNLAALSPIAFLDEHNVGAAICVSAWTIAMGLLAYIRTVIAGILREANGNSEKRLFWCGVFTQLGSFVGALVMFPLVSMYQLFEMAPMC